MIGNSFSMETGDIDANRDTTLSSDPEDAKWDHFREDTLLHVFHKSLHTVNQARLKEAQPRISELFWYAHQQLTRR